MSSTLGMCGCVAYASRCHVVGHLAYAVHSGARVAGSPRDRLRDVILYIVRGPHYFGILYPCSCGFMILADIWIFWTFAGYSCYRASSCDGLFVPRGVGSSFVDGDSHLG